MSGSETVLEGAGGSKGYTTNRTISEKGGRKTKTEKISKKKSKGGKVHEFGQSFLQGETTKHPVTPSPKVRQLDRPPKYPEGQAQHCLQTRKS